MLWRLAVRQSSVLAVHRPFPLEYLRNGVPVAVIRLDPVLYHPFFNRLIRSFGDIPDSLNIPPQSHKEAVAYALVQRPLSFWRQVVIRTDILMFEERQHNLHLSRQRFYLRYVILAFRLQLEMLHEDVTLRRTPFQRDRVRAATLMSEPLSEIRFKRKKDGVCHSCKITKQINVIRWYYVLCR